MVYSNAESAEIEIDDVEIGGLSIHLARHRAGTTHHPPLLIFNGIGAGIDVFFSFLRTLQGVETLIFDVPGVGGSSRSLLPLRLRRLAALSRKVLDHFDIPEVDILGMSWGGFLAQEFAYRHPERCRRLILAATSAGVMMVPGQLPVLAMLASPWRFLQRDFVRHHAACLYGGQLCHQPELLDDYWQAHHHNATPLDYYWQLFACAGWTSIHWLHRLQQPTLILAGGNDPLMPLINAQLLYMQIPNSVLEVVDDGHLFLFASKEAMAHRIGTFLRTSQPV